MHKCGTGDADKRIYRSGQKEFRDRKYERQRLIEIWYKGEKISEGDRGDDSA